ncbi:MAG TPA: VOC family protein [Candidatus Angelobacter sp.]|jgi:catechol 2,3-dioxygenase-like lactoylglutathione lyase family enzyme|nr:VOC family protein [Candidatus Angelobacter sp.]
MLSNCRIVGVIATNDYERARSFYEGKLGFRFVSLDQFALALRAGENMIRVVKLPDYVPRQGTMLGWEVQDIEAEAADLRERGVTLEKYPFVQDQELGIWTAPGGDRVAWFLDPDGNVLSISQHVS